MTTPLHEGEVALITRRDFGNGQATAIELAGGADVVVHIFYDADGAESTKRNAERAWTHCHLRGCDVGIEDQMAAMFDQALDAVGAVHALMNYTDVDASGISAVGGYWPLGPRYSHLAVLASSDADCVTGALYVMDGGLNDQPSSQAHYDPHT